jgi:hypothetical protein
MSAIAADVGWRLLPLMLVVVTDVGSVLYCYIASFADTGNFSPLMR